MKSKHLKVAKFALTRNEQIKIKGGTPGGGGVTPGCIDCTCHSTSSSGCISGTGTDLGAKAAS